MPAEAVVALMTQAPLELRRHHPEPGHQRHHAGDVERQGLHGGLRQRPGGRQRHPHLPLAL